MKRLILGAAMLAIFAVSLSLTSHGATAQTPPASTSTSTPSPTATRTPTSTPTPSPTPSPTAVPAAAAAAAPAGPAAVEDAGPTAFACYSLDLNETSDVSEDAGAEEGAGDRTLRIVTEQGHERINVAGLELLCVSSARDGEEGAQAPAAEDTRVLACYAIDDGNDIRDGFSFTTEGYGTDAVVLRESELVCEEASMTLEDDTTVGKPTGVAWLCQRLRGGDDADVDLSYANLFGPDDAEVDNAVVLCAIASEFGAPVDKPVAPTAQVVETEKAEEPITLLACFDLDKAAEPEVTVTIETLTFGSVDVFVGNASLWCESATVTPRNSAANGGGDKDEEEDDDAPQRPIVTAAGTNGLDANGDDVETEIARLIEQLRDDPTDATIDRLMDLIHDHDDADFGDSQAETVG